MNNKIIVSIKTNDDHSALRLHKRNNRLLFNNPYHLNSSLDSIMLPLVSVLLNNVSRCDVSAISFTEFNALTQNGKLNDLDHD